MQKLRLRIVCLLVLIIFSFNVKAQIFAGIEAGMTLSELSYNYTFNPYTLKNSFIVGGRAGIIADINIGKIFALQPGIFYSMKGGKTNYQLSYFGLTINEKVKLTFNCIDIPLMLLVKFNLGPGKIFAGVGPNIGIGISGKGTASGYFMGYSVDSSISVHYGSDSDKVKRFDFGGNANVGYETNFGFYIRCGYNMGFANISNQDYVTVKNKGFNFSIGYLINRRRK